MNPELKEKSKKQIEEQRIAVLHERFREEFNDDMQTSSLVRTTALRFLIKYYMKKIYWYVVGILIGLTIYNVVQIWFGH